MSKRYIKYMIYNNKIRKFKLRNLNVIQDIKPYLFTPFVKKSRNNIKIYDFRNIYYNYYTTYINPISSGI